MSNIKSIIAAATLTLGMVQNVSAQQKEETKEYPYAFIGVQGGAQAIINGAKLSDVIAPVGQINGGMWWSPALGTRITLQGGQSKEGVSGLGTYKFTYGSANIDLMINLSNLVCKSDKHPLDVILLGGFGANKAFGNEWRDIEGYPYTGTPGSRIETGSKVHNHVTHNDRLGLILSYNISDNVAVNLEGQANHYGSRDYAVNVNGGRDWQVAAFAGITIKLNSKKKQTKPESTVVAQDYDNSRQAETATVPAPTPEKKREDPKPVVKAKENIQKEIFFKINKTDGTEAESQKIAEAAEWLKAHPTAKATIKGYADKGTGTAEINARMAKSRADNVAKKLTVTYGIDASRLEVSSYGDTVQPKAENDDNRLVIIVATEQ